MRIANIRGVLGGEFGVTDTAAKIKSMLSRTEVIVHGNGYQDLAR